jgi:hypothetical protein
MLAASDVHTDENPVGSGGIFVVELGEEALDVEGPCYHR